MKHSSLLAVAAALATCSAITANQLPQPTARPNNLQSCTTIKDEKVRLACYDVAAPAAIRADETMMISKFLLISSASTGKADRSSAVDQAGR
jgi:hypothetical protein